MPGGGKIGRTWQNLCNFMPRAGFLTFRQPVSILRPIVFCHAMGDCMKSSGVRAHLLAILFSGLTLGALGLLEPLIRFRKGFHLLGASWPWLLLVYLGMGIAVAALAGVAVGALLARRRPPAGSREAAAYYATATALLSAVLVFAPILRHAAGQVGMRISFAALFPVLLIVGALLAWRLTPRIAPLLGRLLGRPGGGVSPRRVAMLMLACGLVVLATVYADVRSRYRAGEMAPAGPRVDGGAVKTPDGEAVDNVPGGAVQNLLLITIDALRADHLSLYGYSRPTSPHLDAYAAGAVVFDHCVAQGNSTELSMPAIFTSLYPSMHSVTRRGSVARPLPEETQTLAEHLRAAGLRTSGMMTNPFIKREWGLTQGFETIDEFQIGREELLPCLYLIRLGLVRPFERTPQTRSSPRAAVVADRAIAQLRNLRARPFYLHVHFMDVHHPYIPPEEYEKMFASPAAAGASSAVDFWKRGWERFTQNPSSRANIEAGEVQRLIDLYDGSIRYVDEEVARLLRELDALGLSARTMVIITADHGDEFLEHGDLFHKSPFLYDELTHIPLIVKWPGATSGQRREETVRQIDLLPTLLQVFDLPPSTAAQGRSLVPLLTGDEGPGPGVPWADLPAFSESYEFTAVRTPGNKCMAERKADGRTLCFDLLSDPGERRAIQGECQACDSLRQALLDFQRRRDLAPPDGSGRELDERTREQLRSLGYL